MLSVDEAQSKFGDRGAIISGEAENTLRLSFPESEDDGLKGMDFEVVPFDALENYNITYRNNQMPSRELYVREAVSGATTKIAATFDHGNKIFCIMDFD